MTKTKKAYLKANPVQRYAINYFNRVRKAIKKSSPMLVLLIGCDIDTLKANWQPKMDILGITWGEFVNNKLGHNGPVIDHVLAKTWFYRFNTIEMVHAANHYTNLMIELAHINDAKREW